MSGKVVVFNHPLMTHKLAIIRNEKTNTKDFRETVSEIANLMAYEATRDLPARRIGTITISPSIIVVFETAIGVLTSTSFTGKSLVAS